MAELVNQKIGEEVVENLINQTYPPADVFTVKIRKGQGKLLRGTVLALSGGELGDGTMVILGTAPEISGEETETLTANCILAEPIKTGDENAVGLAYRTGHFNRNCLLAKDGYQITAEDKEALRTAGILLSDAMEY